ncbi:MAG: FAD-dependent monooxygenase [Candidatus Izemoplasmatales bacterium]
MERDCDVLVVGGATTGSYVARKLAERGHRVVVVEIQPEDRVGSKYDIFHIAEPDFRRFGLPEPVAGEDLAFRFTGSRALSAFGNHPKEGFGTVVGMHMHGYTLRMNRWAKEAGAEFLYETRFVDFAYADGRIAGARIADAGGERTITANLVADCSGIPSIARGKLPAEAGVETFAIGPKDMFYVILRYVTYLDEKDFVKSSRSWTFYKTWEAPQADPRGAILGVGANFSFEYADRIYHRFEAAIELPRRTLDHVERGTTPYRRPPYSFVADGFVAMGDAACLTKPHAGEGVTSSMVQADIVVDVVDRLLREGGPLTRDRLWPINRRYYAGQGKIYAGMLATLVGAVSTTPKENEFFFRHDVVFSAKSFAAMGEDKPLSFSGAEMVRMALWLLWGILSFRIRVGTVASLLRAMKNGDVITNLYGDYPESADGFDAWKTRAETVWAKTPGMADVVDPAKD